MFNNIGEKIKKLAEILCWVGIIGYGLIGLITCMVSPMIGIILLLIGPLTSWISSFFMYGFGELIEKVSNIEYCARRGVKKPVNLTNSETEKNKKLEQLHSQGLITDEEYQQAISKKN